MSLFWITVVLFVTVIAIGNYLLFNKVLPTLGEPAEMMPSEQANQIEKYLGTLEKSKKRGFSFLFLKHYQKIQALMGLLLVINILYFSIFS